MKIKICGISSEKTLTAINRALPDFIGFVFAKSPRRVTHAQAASLKTALNPAVRAVGVFVNEKPQTISRLYAGGVIDLVQLHGEEDEAYIAALKAMISAPVIKAIGMDERGNFTSPVPKNCDLVLTDTRTKYARGGTGIPWRWRRPDTDKPVILAGGINAENAAEAAEIVRPYALDISGGAETDGVKDGAKIEELVRLVRSMEEL